MKKIYSKFNNFTQTNFGKNGKYSLIVIAVIILCTIGLAKLPENATQVKGLVYQVEKEKANRISVKEAERFLVEGGDILLNQPLNEGVIISKDKKNYLVSYPKSYEATFIKKVMESELKNIEYSNEYKGNSATTNRIIMFTILYGVLIIALMSRRKQNKAQAYAKVASDNKITTTEGELVEYPSTVFEDVAGCDEAKEQLRELVDFLKYPEKYKEIGAKIPKGALLVGPPGTGKTLLARAIAGEAKVPFFSASGSDFAEIFVGMGAKRVRELFKKAKSHERSIVFIDEIDAIARHRSSSPHNQDSERENTLIALLTEMDGFNQSDTIVIAATNRADILDTAITRPGRLDRLVSIPLPDAKGREAILITHAAGKKISPNVDLKSVARATAGFSGAELAMVLNEACISAVKNDRLIVESIDINNAISDAMIGVARKSAVVSMKDRNITAWHEAGHALVAYKIKEAPQPRLVSITPRGVTGGVTWLEQSDNFYMTKNEALAKIAVAMGGRVGEEILLNGEYTQGASSDLKKATDIAYTLINNYGMSSLGLTYREERSENNEKISNEINAILNKSYLQAKKILTKNNLLLQKIAKELLLHEEITFDEIARFDQKLKYQLRKKNNGSVK